MDVSHDFILGIVYGVPIGWYLNVFYRNVVVPALIRHGRR